MASRTKKAKLSIVFSLIRQAVTFLCGLAIPKLMLGAFGSELYGATASIAQFLGYISLLEGGIGGVARAALYKPLAENDMMGVSMVVSAMKKFFRTIAIVFSAYVVVLACTFKYISDFSSVDWLTSFLLVVVISISTFAQYFIGVSYSMLIQASQKLYITEILHIGTTILNTVLVFVLIKQGFGIVTVKFVSGLVFTLRPVLTWLYVRKDYKLVECRDAKVKELLPQRWTGLGQHLAYYLHSHTDTAVLTIFSGLKSVSVYSVHHMVTSNIQNITVSFTSGMEALFGDMIAKNETKNLNRAFGFYETLISFVSVPLFSVVTVLITPFITLYTANVKDGDTAIYFQPLFAVMLTVASLLFCLRSPYQHVVTAAGHFKQTRMAAYGEAIINIVTSVVLVGFLGLVGVAIGTVLATGFRFCYYAIYLNKNILYRKPTVCIKRLVVNAGTFALINLFGRWVAGKFSMPDYLRWAMVGVIVTAMAFALETVVTAVFYREDLKGVLAKLLRRKKFKPSEGK